MQNRDADPRASARDALECDAWLLAARLVGC
jgi:hypothetical protein